MIGYHITWILIRFNFWPQMNLRTRYQDIRVTIPVQVQIWDWNFPWQCVQDKGLSGRYRMPMNRLCRCSAEFPLSVHSALHRTLNGAKGYYSKEKGPGVCKWDELQLGIRIVCICDGTKCNHQTGWKSFEDMQNSPFIDRESSWAFRRVFDKSRHLIGPKSFRSKLISVENLGKSKI